MERDYIYDSPTTSLCPKCMKQVPAKIILQKNAVYIRKTCETHGEQKELLEEDAEYHKSKKEFDKPGTISKTQTKIRNGCPFDCGLCTDHDQHTCIALIEVTNNCNLKCPTCYARSGDGEFLSLNTINRMMDFLIETEGGEAEILQISGGEPTLHPDIIKIIELARTKKIRYIMLNTNGIRIAEDEAFAKALGAFKGRFEVYLQFDGFSGKIYSRLRGKDVSKLKLKAIENLRKNNIPITLVSTIQKGVNEDEIGKIIQFGMDTSCIRGVNFQPVAYFGRGTFKNANDRITLSGMVRRIEQQLPKVFQKGDLVPLPCNVERVSVTYMVRSEKNLTNPQSANDTKNKLNANSVMKANNTFVPITRDIKIKSYLPLIDNTFAFDADRLLRKQTKALLTGSGACNCMGFIKDITKIIPLSYALKSEQEKLDYLNDNTFRISITSFIDAYNFDLKSMQKECVHIITPDLKKIPFSAYNMIYRK
jgi:7,8-dihydro-6-hydroxymethylpterin dimethyltransferase